nr:myb-related protein 1-like isoform X3 [Ipomoea batatas]
MMMSTPGRNETKEVKRAALSGVRKPRFKWTVEVHQRFVDAVNQLGGIHRATPKNIMTLMDIQQITTEHIKSHLQKYRLSDSKQPNTTTNTRKSNKLIRATVFQPHQEHKYSITPGLHTMGRMQVSDVPEISTERQNTSQTKLEFEREYQGTLEQSSNNEGRQYPQVEDMELSTEQLEKQRKMAQKEHISIMNNNSYSLSSPMESTNGTTVEIERKNNFLKPHKEKGKFPYYTTSARTTDNRELIKIIPEKKSFDAAPLKISLDQMEKGSTSSGFSADETHKRGKCYQVYASPTSAAQNMVAEDNKTSYKDFKKAMNASNEKSFDLNKPAKEQEE